MSEEVTRRAKTREIYQAACVYEDTCSSGTDANADLPGGANPAAPDPKQDKPKKKCSRKRQRTSEEDHMAHMGMWQGCENDE